MKEQNPPVATSLASCESVNDGLAVTQSFTTPFNKGGQSEGQMCPNCSGLNTNAVKACGGFTYDYICNDCKFTFTVRLFLAGAAA
jgi:hypothetical protein